MSPCWPAKIYIHLLRTDTGCRLENREKTDRENQSLCYQQNLIISDILPWTPSHGRAKAERPARTYILQLCADTGYSLEDLLGAVDDRDGWRKRVREICAGSGTWWLWYISIYMQSVYLLLDDTLTKAMHSKIRMSFYFKHKIKSMDYLNVIFVNNKSAQIVMGSTGLQRWL